MLLASWGLSETALEGEVLLTSLRAGSWRIVGCTDY